MAHRACGRAGSRPSRDVCPRGAVLLELLPRSQAPASGAEPFCSDPVGIFISKPPNSSSGQCSEHARGLLVRRQRRQAPCPLPPAVGAAAHGTLPVLPVLAPLPCLQAPGIRTCPPTPLPSSVCSPLHAKAGTVLLEPGQLWGQSGTSLALSPPLGHAPCRCPCGVLGCSQPDTEHW